MTSFSKESRLEQNYLWQLASDVAVFAYDNADSISEDDRVGMQDELRGRAFDLTCDIADAAGSIDPRDKAHYYGHALRNAYSVRNIVLIATRTGHWGAQPEILVKLDKITEGLRKEVSGTAEDIPEYLKQFAAPDSGKGREI